MKRVLTLLLLSACTGDDGRAPLVEAAEPSAVESLVLAERAFARDANARTVGAAFVAALAEDGLLFRPDAVAGRAYTTQNPPPADFHLDWEPEYVEISHSGDLGFSTGPFEAGRRGQPPGSFGRFLSIWRRVDGAWRVALDHGIGHAGPRPEVSAVETRTGTGEAAGTAPEAADDEFNRALASAGAAAYGPVVSDDVRVLRDGAPPAIGAAAEGLLGRPMATMFERVGGGVAEAGDLAWSHGVWRSATGHGHYVRVWRSEAGVWRLAADLVDGG